MDVHPFKVKTLGILGGGQLGRMLCAAARSIGIRTVVVDPAQHCPAAGACDELILGRFDDDAAVGRLAGCDAVTVEIEHVSVSGLAALAATGVAVHPAPSTIALIQDKFSQKVHFRKGGVPLGDFRSVSNTGDVLDAALAWGFPLMLKSRRGAYDGRGNAVVSSADDIDAAWSALATGDRGGGLFVERWVPFVRELAVLVARSTSGECVVYPTVQTVQRDSICHLVFAPAPAPRAVLDAAAAVARATVDALEGAGVYGVELFELADGTVLLNEVAPRVHNSGHLTIEACHVSQFEQHVRAVLGMPLRGSEMRVVAAAMINILGGSDDGADVAALCARALSTRAASLHWYGKAEARRGRKLGHITVTGMSPMDVAAAVDAVTGARCDAAHVHTPLVGVIMGSDSDLPTMAAAAQILADFGVPFEVTIVSAHRTPRRLVDYATTARTRGLRVIIAAAGGAAHLPGMVAALTPLPVVGVPIPLHQLDGMDSLLSIVQMPRGVPVATVAIGNATNGALLAVRILGASIPSLLDTMEEYQRVMESGVLDKVADMDSRGWRAFLATR